MPALDFSPVVLEGGIFQNPAQIVLADKVDIESSLREEPTTGWKKGWSERAYDFPNTYVNMPIQIMETNPISTFSTYQNERFGQRYFNKKM